MQITDNSGLGRQVFRMDKTTHRPTSDPEAIEKFKKKLKKIVADQVRAHLHPSRQECMALS